MKKFVLLYKHAISQGVISQNGDNLYIPEICSIEDLSIVHSEEYLMSLQSNGLTNAEARRMGLPWSEKLIERTFTAPNGTLLTARKALETGMASHLAGGTHHAHRDFASGFCMVNDLAYASRSLIRNGEVRKILIFDCDVHQGDGTAAILQNDPEIFTCSIHCEKNFPFRKSQSNLDVGLDLYMEDAEYLSIVQDTLERLIEQERPDLIFYDAGADIWEHDVLGRLNITWAGMQERDERVLTTCLRHHIPVATVIGGGYDEDHARLARRHGIVVETASRLFDLYL